MPEALAEQSQRVLKPMERISEIWFGLTMVLIITCSVSVTEAVSVSLFRPSLPVRRLE